MNIQRKNSAHHFRMQSEREQTLIHTLPFFMFICQNLGNLKGFLLVYLHGLDLITLSSYSSTGRGTSYSNNKKKKIKYLSIQLLIRGTCRGATELWNKHREFPYLTSLFF